MARNTSDRNPPRSLQERQASRKIAEMWAVACTVQNELIKSGSVSENLRQELHSSVAGVAFVLYPARTEDEIEWEEATPFDEGPSALMKSVFDGEQRAVLPSGEHNPEPEIRRTPSQIDAHTLYRCAVDLHELAYKLGLGFETDPQRGTVEADPL